MQMLKWKRVKIYNKDRDVISGILCALTAAINQLNLFSSLNCHDNLGMWKYESMIYHSWMVV